MFLVQSLHVQIIFFFFFFFLWLCVLKVFCATCCSLKCRLMYMDRKEARVCVTCHSALTTGEHHCKDIGRSPQLAYCIYTYPLYIYTTNYASIFFFSNLYSFQPLHMDTFFLTSANDVFLSLSAQSWETPAHASNQSPNPNNPAEYCSTIPPLQQAQASGVLSSPPPTVMVPVGVLKQPGNEGTTFTRNKNALSTSFFTFNMTFSPYNFEVLKLFVFIFLPVLIKLHAVF